MECPHCGNPYTRETSSGFLCVRYLGGVSHHPHPIPHYLGCGRSFTAAEVESRIAEHEWQRRERERPRQAGIADARRRKAILERLQRASSAAEILRLLDAAAGLHDSVTKSDGWRDAGCCAWRSLIASGGLIRNEYEVVRVEGRKPRFGHMAFAEVTRSAAWAMELESLLSLIDADGTVWRTFASTLEDQRTFPEREHGRFEAQVAVLWFAVPAGTECRIQSRVEPNRDRGWNYSSERWRRSQLPGGRAVTRVTMSFAAFSEIATGVQRPGREETVTKCPQRRIGN
jgi:hypothetical protein